MPQMGYDMQEGTVVRWLKTEGSPVKMGEPVAEIETDKAVVEFESYADGILQKILVAEGSTVPVGQVIAIVAAEGEQIEVPSTPAPTPPAAQVKEAAPEPEPEPAPVAEAQPAPAPSVAPVALAQPSSGPVKASPVARRLADERGISLSRIQGTGPGGRITKDDVLDFAGEPAPSETLAPSTHEDQPSDFAPSPVSAPAPDLIPASAPKLSGETVPLSRMRQQIARVTVRSKSEKPHFYVAADIDMTEAMSLRPRINAALESEGLRVTVNDLIVKACVEALKLHPKFNAFYTDQGIKMNAEINVGIAMAVEEGLLMPAIMDCASKSLKQIAEATKDLATRAQGGTLRPAEYQGGTFAISNLGMFDVTSFIAIIQPPQSAILAVGTVGKKPVVRDDEIVIRQIMTATIAGDHRVVDGAEGARFLMEVKRLLENPLSMLL